MRARPHHVLRHLAPGATRLRRYDRGWLRGDLVAGGIDIVAVSLGGDGALLVTADELVHARATITAPLSTVGAGDCMLAGLLHGLSSGRSAADALAGAVTWGAAAVTLPGSRVPAPHDLDGIPVEVTRSPDPSLVLR